MSHSSHDVRPGPSQGRKSENSRRSWRSAGKITGGLTLGAGAAYTLAFLGTAYAFPAEQAHAVQVPGPNFPNTLLEAASESQADHATLVDQYEKALEKAADTGDTGQRPQDLVQSIRQLNADVSDSHWNVQVLERAANFPSPLSGLLEGKESDVRDRLASQETARSLALALYDTATSPKPPDVGPLEQRARVALADLEAAQDDPEALTDALKRYGALLDDVDKAMAEAKAVSAHRAAVVEHVEDSASSRPSHSAADHVQNRLDQAQAAVGRLSTLRSGSDDTAHRSAARLLDLTSQSYQNIAAARANALKLADALRELHPHEKKLVPVFAPLEEPIEAGHQEKIRKLAPTVYPALREFNAYVAKHVTPLAKEYDAALAKELLPEYGLYADDEEVFPMGDMRLTTRPIPLERDKKAHESLEDRQRDVFDEMIEFSQGLWGFRAQNRAAGVEAAASNGAELRDQMVRERWEELTGRTFAPSAEMRDYQEYVRWSQEAAEHEAEVDHGYGYSDYSYAGGYSSLPFPYWYWFFVLPSLLALNNSKKKR